MRRNILERSDSKLCHWNKGEERHLCNWFNWGRLERILRNPGKESVKNTLKTRKKRNKNGKLAMVACLMLNGDWLKFCATALHILDVPGVMGRKVPLNIYFFILVWKTKWDTFTLNGRDFCEAELLLTWKLVNEFVWMNLKLFL